MLQLSYTNLANQHNFFFMTVVWASLSAPQLFYEAPAIFHEHHY